MDGEFRGGVEGGDGRSDAHREVQGERDRIAEIALELKRRASGEWLRARAKEAAVKKSIEVKDWTIDSPIAIGLIAGCAAAAIGGLLKKRRSAARLEPDYLHD